MLARLTATTDLTGLRVECLLAPVRGMAGDAVGVGVVGVVATTVVEAGVTDGAAMAMVAGSLADADLRVVPPAASTGRLALGFVAALWPTAVAGSTVAEDSTVVVAGSTAAAVDTAAVDTGNRGGSGVS